MNNFIFWVDADNWFCFTIVGSDGSTFSVERDLFLCTFLSN